MGVAIDDGQQQLCLLVIGDGCEDFQQIILGRDRDVAILLGRCQHEVPIQAEKDRERFERAGHPANARQRLGVVVPKLLLHGRQPRQVEQPEIARKHVTA